MQVIYNNKVYYVGCEGCKATFLKDPETYAKKAESLSKQQGKPVKANTDARPPISSSARGGRGTATGQRRALHL